MRICSIEGCEGLRKSKLWCGRHYSRHLRHGDPLAGGLDRLPSRGESLTVAQLARLANINYKTLRDRLVKYRWPVERALLRGGARAVS